MSGRSMEALMPDGSSVDFPEKMSELEQQQEQEQELESEPDVAQGRPDNKKIKFNPKPLRDHGHMRHGPIQGTDAGEEAAAMMCNFVWSFTKGGGRRIGGLIVAVPKYGASHLAAYLKSKLSGHSDGKGEGALEEGGEAKFVAKEGDRLATKEDFVKLNIDPAVVERFNTALNDRNIDSLQIANPDGSMKFIIKAHDVDAVNQALDDIIGMPDKELDEQHAVVAQAQAFAQDTQTSQKQETNRDVGVDDKVADYRQANWNARSTEEGGYAFDYQGATTKTSMKDADEIKHELARYGFAEGKDYSVASPKDEHLQAKEILGAAQPAAMAAVLANQTYTFTFADVDAEKISKIEGILDAMSEDRSFEQNMDDGKKDARQRGLERGQERGLTHEHGRDSESKDLTRQKSRGSDQGR